MREIRPSGLTRGIRREPDPYSTVAAAKRPPASSASLLDLEMNRLSCRQSILPTNYLGMIERGDERHPA